MIDLYFYLQFGFAMIIGLLLTLAGVFGVKPKAIWLFPVAFLEVLLIIQLALFIVMLTLGASAVVDNWQFAGYLLVALLLPPAGAIWALAEKSRWSMVVLGFSAFTVGVMLGRMHQIWTGQLF
jgi:hypothetical protein